MPKLNFEDWAGRPPTKVERQLVDAAIAKNVTSATSCTFVELVRSSEDPIQKDSAYRACPGGMVGVIELLENDTVRVIFNQAFEALAELRDQPDGADASLATVVETGIDAVLRALSDAAGAARCSGRTATPSRRTCCGAAKATSTPASSGSRHGALRTAVPTQPTPAKAPNRSSGRC